MCILNGEECGIVSDTGWNSYQCESYFHMCGNLRIALFTVTNSLPYY